MHELAHRTAGPSGSGGLGSAPCVTTGVPHIWASWQDMLLVIHARAHATAASLLQALRGHAALPSTAHRRRRAITFATSLLICFLGKSSIHRCIHDQGYIQNHFPQITLAGATLKSFPQ